MMSFENRIQLIRNGLSSHISNINGLENWLKALASGSLKDQRLFASLYIEIRENLIDMEALALVLNQINYEEYIDLGNPSKGFEDVLMTNKHLHFLSNEKSAGCELGNYVKVLDVNSFVLFYYNHIDDLDDLHLIADRELVIRKIENGVLQDFSLMLIGKPWRAIHWVTDSTTMRELTSGQSADDAATNVANQLGLMYPNDVEPLMYLAYDKQFCGETYQPCCINGQWDVDGLYLSYGCVDQYGRTVPCTRVDASIECRKERVHVALSERMMFSANYIGKAGRKSVDALELDSEIKLRIDF